MADKKETLQDKLYKELYKAGLDDVANVVADLEDDDEVRKYMWGNRGFFDKMYNDEDFQMAPTFSDLVHNDYTGGKIDYDKQFGKDWDKNFNDISVNKIKYEAMKAGKDWKKMLNEMSTEATKRERYRIAHGEEEGGWFDSPKAFARNLHGAATNMFAPRSQEAIERGEEPSLKDQALDAGQNVLESLPWGRALKGAGVGTRYLLSNATTPFVTEALDAAAYDEGPRGDFSLSDATVGAGINVAAPVAMNFAGRKVAKYGPEGTRDMMKKLGNFGNLEENSAEEVANKLRHGQTTQSEAQRQWTRYQKGQNLTEKQMQSAAQFDPNYKAQLDNVKHKLQKGQQLTREEFQLAARDENLSSSLFKNSKTRKQLLGEESMKNLITNKYGDVAGEQGAGLSKLPFGTTYLNWRREQDKEAQRKAEEQEILDELRTRGLLMGDR